MKKKIIIGILAHVDAGKTTLSEAMLYVSGKIRKAGRVDHGNTYLDTNEVERERGITIFSKQARFSFGECEFILLDTPGHVDFSAETERTLSLLDYAVLVVSAPDGVQNHTRTLWELLGFYGVPTFIFVNKTDVCIKTKGELEAELCAALSPKCVAIYENQTKEELDEKLAMQNEAFLDSFFEGEPIDNGEISALISKRELYPCLFGSALRMTGVEFFLEVLERYTLLPVYPEEAFGARVYKIARAGNTRLTYMKITSGALSARDELRYTSSDGKNISEKVSQIRLYSGEKFEQTESASAGEICAVSGLSSTYAGQGLGMESDSCKPILEPVLAYSIILPDGCDPVLYFPKFKELEEEEPSLHLYWNAELSQIEARLMGEIQIDLLKRLISDRFGIQCNLDTGKILYKEKIAERTIGVGHFEPLRHYAEVQLILEPMPKGTGLIIENKIAEGSLEVNWQSLILSNLYEKAHRGTLTGALLTDTKISLVAGKAHQKHTEGGDFREAALRAVRHGLMKAGCVLLEPYYKFRLEVPEANVGRAMSDLQARCAEFAKDASDGEFSVIVGRAPVSELHDYTRELISYTRGKGRLTCTSDGYEPCHNAEQIVEEVGYDPEGDTENTPHSVFCAGGAGFTVLWREVDEHKHLDVTLAPDSAEAIIPKQTSIVKRYNLSEDELEAIMLRTFGAVNRKRYSEPKGVSIAKKEKARKKPAAPDKHMIIIDGYNVIHSWDALCRAAKEDIGAARDMLMDILSNYAAYTKTEITLVFDAYQVKDGRGSDIIHDGYRVVYTKQDETADTFIEKMMAELGPNYNIRVVTGDRLVQISAVTSGIMRMTAKEFESEVMRVSREIDEFLRKLKENRR